VDAAALTAALKARCREEGFDAVGIASADPLERDVAALESWLDAKHHAGMDWMEKTRERRADPGKVLPGCRSVVIVALNYWPGEEQAQRSPGQARVALYAQARDYHKVIGAKLKRVARWLDEQTSSESRSFVDTAPVLERGWAQRSGIGWIGKNANLLTTTMGSWVLLGELLTTAELVPDSGPHADHCGSCRACIDACPTGAIIAEGRVDANRCISYWTIEHRGSVPVERRAGNGDWIFGCDLCQTVCPWNESHALEVSADHHERRVELSGLDAVEILSLDEATFRERYSGTPLMRAKWEGMRRNACIVLAASPDARADAALRDALEDADDVVREHARWALETRLVGGVGADVPLS
jgi:epoxyqueuosine reductase